MGVLTIMCNIADSFNFTVPLWQKCGMFLFGLKCMVFFRMHITTFFIFLATSEWIQFFKEAGIPPGLAVNYAMSFVDNR